MSFIPSHYCLRSSISSEQPEAEFLDSASFVPPSSPGPQVSHACTQTDWCGTEQLIGLHKTVQSTCVQVFTDVIPKQQVDTEYSTLHPADFQLPRFIECCTTARNGM